MFVYDVARFARWVSFAAIFVAAFGSANAASFTLSGGTTQTLLSNFNPAGWDQPANNNIGAGSDISVFSASNSAGGLSVDGPAILQFTFLGTEAGYENSASLAGSQLFLNHSAAYGDTSGLFSVAAGLVEFAFTAITPGSNQASNGGPINANVLLGILKASSSVAYLFFEDIAAGGDGDFDDLVLRVEIVGRGDADPEATPLPGAIWLFGSALVGVSGVCLRRRRRSASEQSVA